MAPLADFLLTYVPISLPRHLSSYVPGETPLSTTPVVVTTLIGYLAVIFGLQAIMKNKQAYKLTPLFQAHNVILSSGSLLLLVLMLEEIVPIIWNDGVFNAICAEKSWTPRMEFYYMINYYFKYLELFDTVFLALKKKPMRPEFLHVFHHSATALLCYCQLNGRTSISWAVIVLNLGVHVVMYYYYYATAGGAKIWELIRTPAAYSHMAAAYYPNTLPHIANCAGSEEAALFGCALLTSYLGLFINFYFQTYKRPASSAKSNGISNGKANG
ncbi:hypothetical protein H0H92_007200 [Tricholoma furcatifolium]|nr:hypothetical protein H0H92_007200 [Tricholoma furcatifolium]